MQFIVLNILYDLFPYKRIDEFTFYFQFNLKLLISVCDLLKFFENTYQSIEVDIEVDIEVEI